MVLLPIQSRIENENFAAAAARVAKMRMVVIN
jgi:hypothetical protein